MSASHSHQRLHSQQLETNALDQGPTALAWHMALTYDLDLQSPASCGHNLLIAKVQGQSQSVPKIKWKETERQTDGQTDGRTDRGDCITSFTNAVGNLFKCSLLQCQHHCRSALTTDIAAITDKSCFTAQLQSTNYSDFAPKYTSSVQYATAKLTTKCKS